MNYDEPRHTMRVVERRTGLSPHVIRVWEKRYEAVEPGRTGTNRRLYSDADIDRLRLLRAATQQGHAISTIARASTADLEALLHEPAAEPARAATQPPATADFLEEAAAAIETFDDRAFAAVLRRANAQLSKPVMLEQFLLPLLEWLGKSWQSGKIRVAHEHLASVLVRDFLISIRGAYAIEETAPVLLVATPSGQHHELGALIVAEVASGLGWHVVYMGSSLPAEEIGVAARESRAVAVALSIVYPHDDPGLARDLRELVRTYLPAGVTLIVGGSAAAAYRNILEDSGARIAQPVHVLQELLEELRREHVRRVAAGS